VEKRTSGEVLALVQSEGCDFVDLRFCDLPGIMQHVTIPAEVLNEGTFVDGHGFDGSSIRGFQEIQESDMILIPDPETAYIDPFMQHKTLVIHCFVADPVTGESYSRGTRYIASNAEAYMASTGTADPASPSQGLGGLVGELSGPTRTNLVRQLEDSVTAVAAIPPPLADLTDDHVPAVQAAYEQVRAARVTLRTQVASILGITLSFSDSDGDS